jgi:hypothetical protein
MRRSLISFSIYGRGFDVSNTGDYASQCTPAVQFDNTGNLGLLPSSGIRGR